MFNWISYLGEVPAITPSLPAVFGLAIDRRLSSCQLLCMGLFFSF